MGYDEDITDEMLDEMVNQMSKMLEFDGISNSINFKTGCLIQSLVLKNQSVVKSELEDQLRKGEFSIKLPPLQFQLTRTCLNLDEDKNCSLLIKWKKKDPKCAYLTNLANCEIVQNSVDQGMSEWR